MKWLLYGGLALVALFSLRLLAAPLRWGLRLLLHGAAGVLALLAFNFLGDGLRDALDPQDSRDVN